MEIRVERLIAAVPERVLRALTEPGELVQWACKEAQVSAETYRLLGPMLPDGSLGGALHERTEQRLRFAWPLPGGSSQVELTVTAAPQGGHPPADFARVCIVHRQVPEQALPEASDQAESWHCIWTLWLRQLQLWVERAEVVGQFDYTALKGVPIERQLTMASGPERVWGALTRPDLRRRWLTVELGPELRRTEGQEITFAFSAGGPRTTEVTWRLEPVADGQQTLVTVREEGAIAGAFDQHLGWHDYLVALYHETARPLIRQTEWIKAPPERVWPYVATQEGLRRWFSSQIDFEPSEGASWTTRAHGGVLSGKVLALEPPRRLVFSWTEQGVGWPEPEPLVLTLELLPEAGGTRVVLTHAGFENLPEAIRTREFGGYQRGWAGDSLLGLKQLSEVDK